MPDWKAVKFDNEWSIAELVKLGDSYSMLMEDEGHEFFPAGTTEDSLVWSEKGTTAFLGTKGDEDQIIDLS